MSVDKSKKMRETHLNLLNKIFDDIDEQIASDDVSLETLHAFLDKLNDKFETIKNLNDDILNSLNIKNIENEILETEKVNEKIISYRSKINFRIKKLSVSNVPSVENVQAIPANAERKRIDLPKLQINKFYGDPDKYLEFWNQFENIVHKNPDLTDVEKFSYLKCYLSGIAANAIEGLSLTEKNYSIAISMIQDRFGRQDMLVHAHLNNLLNMDYVKNSHDIRGLRNLYDKCIIQIRNLESLNMTSDSYSGLLCPILLKLIPPDLTLEFTRNLNNNEKWNVHNIMNFLKNEIESRERVLSIHELNTGKSLSYNNKAVHKQKIDDKSVKYKAKFTHGVGGNTQRNNLATEFVSSIDQNKCIFCNKDHSSEMCSTLTVDEKKDILRKQGRCFLCLECKHRIKDCVKRKMCDICNKKHNKSICFQLEKNLKVDTEKSIVSISHCNNSTQNVSDENDHSKIFLQTCSVIAKNSTDDTNEPVRVLLDNGSMRTFITRDISQKLNLPVIRKETLSVYAFGAEKATEKIYNVVKVKLQNREEPSLNIEVEALETEQISAASLPTPDKFFRKTHKKLKGLQLADSYECNNNKISVLIGTDYYYDIVSGRIKRIKDKLVATETLFGWCLQGYTGSANDLFSMKIIVEERDISEQIKNFWQLESLGIESYIQDENTVDDEIMTDFQSNIVYKNNRYKVKFPWKTNLKQSLKNNKDVAYKRFLKLRTNLRNDPEFFTEYKAVLDNYLENNIIEPVQNICEENTFYLPHRAVIRDDKATTRIRIVFDASAHATGELSLNDCLYTGSNLIPDLFSLLIKFRNFPIAITADIQQAFLQIEIDEDDRNFTRFFWDDEPWNEKPDRDFKIYRLTRVLFGVKSSPFLLAATIKHHLQKYIETFPETFQILNECLYVDDLITSQRNLECALATSTESFKIFQEASMVLRKWKTNSPELYDRWKSHGLPVDEIGNNLKLSDQNSLPSKVLGVAWDPNTDTFTFNTQTLENFLSKKLSTKRYLLQTVGRIFDPIGFLSPYTIRIKLIIQDIWVLGLDWDEILPKHLDILWSEWFREIFELNSIKVPRYYLTGVAVEDINHIELHSFADASQKAYGAVVYLRALLKNKEVITSFVAAKCRVAPLKTVSIPRLELLGALLAARLSHKISKDLAFSVNCYFWTDSSITFYWIKGDSEKFKMFVRNRIKEIQSLSNPANWFHCPGHDNPADMLTRGLKVSELKNNRLWWEGPSWLKEDACFWPKLEKSLEKFETPDNKDQLEMKKNAVVHTNILDEHKKDNDLINRYSSFTKLIRISAWCIRFLSNCKLKSTDRKYNHLETTELQNATEKLIKVVQQSTFHSEIKCLKKKHPLPNKSKIINLNVFLDENELLRIGGRLRFSNLSESQKHQILLPKGHHFTNLLIEYYHKKFLHAGTQTTLSLIRLIYWIPSGRSEVRKIISKCIICFKMKKQSLQQMMGDLPRDRLMPSRPFHTTGVDLAGPITTKPNVKRSRIKLKSYIALFICFSTKAVHLEVLSDLTSEAFLACLRRFISRRSKPTVIWSDNATNFKGSSSILKSFYQICMSNKIQNFSAEEEIQWKFIPPASPHFGGLWESNIKSMKQILLKTTKASILNFEELTTLVTQIEAVLNSRPLAPLSDDTTDLQPLTPGHFLVGGPLLGFPESSAVLDSFSLTSRWNLIQKLRMQFWQRWTKEYLSELQARKKWNKPLPNVKVGQLVLLKETHDIPQLWRLARIIKVYTGKDGLVRVVDLKTSSGNLRRSIVNIAPLPFDDVGQPSNGGRHGSDKYQQS